MGREVRIGRVQESQKLLFTSNVFWGEKGHLVTCVTQILSQLSTLLYMDPLYYITLTFAQKYVILNFLFIELKNVLPLFTSFGFIWKLWGQTTSPFYLSGENSASRNWDYLIVQYRAGLFPWKWFRMWLWRRRKWCWCCLRGRANIVVLVMS